MPKLKLLCLHSFRTSSGFLHKQLTQYSNLASTIHQHAELHYLDAPHHAPHDAVAALPERFRAVVGTPNLQWWNAVDHEDGTCSYEGCDVTLAHVADHMRQHGPYDGVLGFSQGGSLAHLLASLQRQSGPRGPADFSFVVCIAARLSRDTSHAALMKGAAAEPLDIGGLVLLGEEDTTVPPALTEDLIRTIREPMVIRVPGCSHKVPRLDNDASAKVRGFFDRMAARASSHSDVSDDMAMV